LPVRFGIEHALNEDFTLIRHGVICQWRLKRTSVSAIGAFEIAAAVAMM
jgi:hypothetical protein